MMKSRSSKHHGFTLIELMIVVGIMAILTAISYPSYFQYVIRGKRSEGRSALLDAAAREERFYSDNNKYATADDTLATGVSGTSETWKYTLTIATTGTYQTYVLTATPTFIDADCGNLTLDQTGTRDRTGAGKTVDECWGK